MLAARTRSGLDETMHDGAVAVMSVDGTLIASSGDIDQAFFLRSASKPFQALVSQECGAGLGPLELAVAAGSHDGDPVHVALVEAMLAGAGLTDADLRCPCPRQRRPDIEIKAGTRPGPCGTTARASTPHGSGLVGNRAGPWTRIWPPTTRFRC